MRKSLSLLLAIAMVFSMFSSLAFAADATELTAQQKYDALADKGIFAGMADGSAGLDQNMNRAQFARVASLILGLPDISATDTSIVTEKPFSDVELGLWYTDEIAAAKEAGIFVGNPDGTFNPNGDITVEQLAVVVVGLLGLEVVEGATVEGAADWAAGYIQAIINNGVDFPTNYSEPATRADLASLAFQADAVINPPVADAVALNVASAVALNSKVVEVSLDTAATAADVAAATATVADAAGTAIAVSSVTAAPWSTDGKSVLVNLGADTTAGTLYTVTIGDVKANFGGISVDTAKPTVSKVESTDFNEIVVTFSEAVLIPAGAVTAAEKYGTKTALETSNVKYSARDKVVYTTSEQKGATLYGTVITGFADLAGNTIDKDEAKTFTGTAKDLSDLKVVAAGANEPEEAVVEFNVNVDGTSLAPEDFKVEEAYGSKTVLEVTEVRLAKKDEKNVAGVALSDATAKKHVILTVPGTKDATLYKVTVSNVDSLYGKAMSSTAADTNKTFTGKKKPSDPFTYAITGGAASSNTSIELAFANKVVKEEAENVANYAFAEAYGDKAALTISKAALSNDGKTVTLTTSAMKAVLYKATVTNIKDVWGNSIKTADSANVVNFSGKAVANKISAISSIAYDTNSDTVIVVTFNQNVGSSVTDVSHYNIDNSVGYPQKAEKVDTGLNKLAQVKLTLPKLTLGKVYKLTVKNLENSDGVAMDSAGVSATFAGKGNTAGKPKLEAVVATDNQTLKLYFDREVTDSSMASDNSLTNTKIWDKTLKVLNTDALHVIEKDGTIDLSTLASHAYQDADNKNVLVVRVNATQGGFKTDQIATAVGAFKIVDGTVNNLLHDDADELLFSPIDTDPAKIKIEGIAALNKGTIRVYFNQPVYGTLTDIGSIKATSAAYSAGDILLSGATAVDSTKKVYDFATSANVDAASYYLNIQTTPVNVQATGQTPDINGHVVLTDRSTGGVGFVALDADQDNIQFSGNTADVGDIKDVQVVATDKKTLTVYFPAQMNATGTFASPGSTATVLNPANYSLVLADGTTAVTMSSGAFTSANITNIEYKSAENKAIITLNATITTTSAVYLKYATTIANAVGNAFVKDGANAVKSQFAIGSADAAKVTIASATYANHLTAPTITVKLNQNAKSAGDISTQAIFDAYFDVKVTVGGVETVVTLANGKITSVTPTTMVGTATDTIVITLDAAAIGVIENNAVGKVNFKAGTDLTGINGEADDADSSATFSH